MTSPKSLIKRKAAKAVVLHSAHGSIAKVRRRPARSAALLSAGATLGTAIGYLLGRRSGAAAAPSTHYAQAPSPSAKFGTTTVGTPA